MSSCEKDWETEAVEKYLQEKDEEVHPMIEAEMDEQERKIYEAEALAFDEDDDDDGLTDEEKLRIVSQAIEEDQAL